MANCDFTYTTIMNDSSSWQTCTTGWVIWDGEMWRTANNQPAFGAYTFPFSGAQPKKPSRRQAAHDAIRCISVCDIDARRPARRPRAGSIVACDGMSANLVIPFRRNRAVLPVRIAG